jgi:hypothetical protein
MPGACPRDHPEADPVPPIGSESSHSGLLTFLSAAKILLKFLFVVSLFLTECTVLWEVVLTALLSSLWP